ncbi:hypothetical protein QVD17_20537 [Tagetes erecta]|uniref:Uncharacterized protein n=1 Tax=Tagetes erecta TaxID=13708 RepID=A0AAD8NY93_TARER|nr:hypothetical protein QVD17_20537 [Tagetes erecta]
MGLLKYIEMEGLGHIKLTSDLLSQHQDIILETNPGIIRHEVGPCHVPETMLHNLFGSHTELDPPATRNVSEKQINSEGGIVNNQLVMVPSFSHVKSEPIEPVDSSRPSNRNTTTLPMVTENNKRSVKRRRKQIVFSESDESSNETDMDVPDLLRWNERKAKEEARLRDRIARYRVRIALQDAQNAKLTKKVKKLKDLNRLNVEKGKKTIGMVAQNTVKHAKELDDIREKLKEVTGELEMERKERVSLEKSLERVSFDRRWLIEEGFQHVVKRLHGSKEFLKPLLAVESKVWSMGAHDGVVEGYARCQDGVPLEDLGIYNPEAEKEVTKAADELKYMQFPYVVALSQCVDRTLDELKGLEPDGMEDEDDDVVRGGN